MNFPDRVTVIHKLLVKPEATSTSIFLEAAIISEQHQRIAARCFEDIAVYDYKAGKISPMHHFMVEELDAVYDSQVQAHQAALKNIATLQERLKKLIE